MNIDDYNDYIFFVSIFHPAHGTTLSIFGQCDVSWVG